MFEFISGTVVILAGGFLGGYSFALMRKPRKAPKPGRAAMLRDLFRRAYLAGIAIIGVFLIFGGAYILIVKW